MENSYEFMNPINWGIKMLVQMVSNEGSHSIQKKDREKEILDLANLLETKILELKAIHTDLVELETWYSLCSIAKIIAQLENRPRMILEIDLNQIQQILLKCQEAKEYYVPMVTGFYRYCKRNALFETSKFLCLQVRHFSEITEESKEYIPALLQNEFSFVLSVCMFWAQVKMQEAQIDTEMLEYDKKLSETLSNAFNFNQYEIAACPCIVSNFTDAETLSKVLFEMFEKVQRESIVDLDKSSQLLDTSKIFLGLEKNEDRNAFVKGLSYRLQATFADDFSTKCQLFKESTECFLKMSTSDRDILYICQCFIDENYGILWKLLYNFSYSIEDDNDRSVILDELFEVANQRVRYGEEFLKTVNWLENESQLLISLVNLIECASAVLEDANLVSKFVHKFVIYLKELPSFRMLFLTLNQMDIDVQSLPEEQLTNVVMNFMELERNPHHHHYQHHATFVLPE